MINEFDFTKSEKLNYEVIPKYLKNTMEIYGAEINENSYSALVGALMAIQQSIELYGLKDVVTAIELNIEK